MSADPITSPSLMQMRAQVPDHVVHREFAEETVVLNLKTGYYHGLNLVGGRMLETLGSSPTVAAAAQSLAAEFEQPLALIEADLSEFCQALVERELLALVPAA